LRRCGRIGFRGRLPRWALHALYIGALLVAGSAPEDSEKPPENEKSESAEEKNDRVHNA
jgi:hypothetical protein